MQFSHFYVHCHVMTSHRWRPSSQCHHHACVIFKASWFFFLINKLRYALNVSLYTAINHALPIIPLAPMMVRTQVNHNKLRLAFKSQIHNESVTNFLISLAQRQQQQHKGGIFHQHRISEWEKYIFLLYLYNLQWSWARQRFVLTENVITVFFIFICDVMKFHSFSVIVYCPFAYACCFFTVEQTNK